MKVRTGRIFICDLILPVIPSTRFFNLKRLLFRWAGINIAAKVRCVSSVRFKSGGPITIGEDTWVGHDVLFVGGEASVTIGKYCDIAPRVLVATGSHKVDLLGRRAAGEGYSSPVRIGDGVWICAGAIILGGTNIGEHSVVCAGAVVRGDFPARSLIGGVPATRLSHLNGKNSGELSFGPRIDVIE